MGRVSLTKAIKNLNIGLYQPKKNKGDTCCQFKEKYLRNSGKNTNYRKIEHEKKKLQIKLSRDLQAIKVCPPLNASVQVKVMCS